MQSRTPNRTALSAAAHHAAHQLLEKGCIIPDPIALPILGQHAERLARQSAENPLSKGMRLFIAARSRFAEDALFDTLERGTRQLVILGAGLDTFAYRMPPRENFRVFEVDHPATQAFKRERLAETGIAKPDAVHFVAVDFTRDRLTEQLAGAGFDPTVRSFFMWLGVVPYLTPTAIWSMLEAVAALPGAEIVFDYGEPPEARSTEARVAHEVRSRRVAALGEPGLTFFDPASLHARLGSVGFRRIEDLNGSDLVNRYLSGPIVSSGRSGGHVLHAMMDAK